jgi:hypothetical protein
MFSSRGLPNVPHVSQVSTPPPDPVPLDLSASGQPIGQAGRLMQNLGISLWQWLFEGPILGILNGSEGIAMGMKTDLRLRLEVLDPDMIALPWEIMQDGPGKQVISRRFLFSRTTSDVDKLPSLRTDHTLKILLVLGQDTETTPNSTHSAHRRLHTLNLEREAAALARELKAASSLGNDASSCQVVPLVQPTPERLLHELETSDYNVFFYAGHGECAPDGGELLLSPGHRLNGTELAQVLTRRQVKLAVFNACWGAQPDHYDLDAGLPASVPAAKPSQAIPRSSLAEVLLHHGVPAVVAMRDSITDEEALTFIKSFARALAQRSPIDKAVSVARQDLMTLYKFNHQAWTLPVLYMHPEFDGELLKPPNSLTAPTILPTLLPGAAEAKLQPTASLRSLETSRVWHMRGDLLRIGRDRAENDVILPDDQGGSRKHAVIIRRNLPSEDGIKTAFLLEDHSTYGTWISGLKGWQKIHRQQVPLQSGVQLQFGGQESEPMEFVVSNPLEITDANDRPQRAS